MGNHMNVSDFYFLGVDPSLTNTGMALIHPKNGIEAMSTITPVKLRGAERLAYIITEFGKFQNHCESKLPPNGRLFYCIEGPSYGSRTSSIYELGELGGLLQYFLFLANKSYIMPSPTEVKKFITEKGNADKQLMAIHVGRLVAKLNLNKYGAFGHCTEHEIDAFGMAIYAWALLEKLLTGCEEAKIERDYTVIDNYINRIDLSMNPKKEKPSSMKGKRVHPKYFLNKELAEFVRALNAG